MNELFRTPRSWDDHLDHLKQVLELLQYHKIYVKLTKCRLRASEVDYVGHIISAQGVKADPVKIKSMLEWPTPKNPKALKGFLGLIGYYRKFIKNYGLLAAPLINLLRKNVFQ